MVRFKDSNDSVFTRAIDRIVSFFHAIAIFTLCLMALLMIYEVVMRYVFNAPAEWALDVVQLVQVTLAFTAAAPVLRDGGHINMEMMQELVKKQTQRRLEILSNGICAAGSLWMAVLGWRSFSQSYKISESTFGITLPIYPFKFLVPLCFFLLALQFLALFVKHIRNRELS